MRPREPRRRVGLHILQRIAHFPPGSWGTPRGDQPRPPAPGRLLLQTIFYLLLSTSYLLTCAFLLTRTPPPSSLGVGGFGRAAPSAADPGKASRSNWIPIRLVIAPSRRIAVMFVHMCACARTCAYGGRFGRLRTIRTRISKRTPCRKAKHIFFP